MKAFFYSFLILAVTTVTPSLAKAQSALDYYGEWAKVKYSAQSDDEKKVELAKLESALEVMQQSQPKNTEAIIVLATVKSTHASLIGGMSALPKIKKARALFQDAIEQDEKAMDGQAHAILGALYYSVPGWPIAFGSSDKAEKHLKKAIEIAPMSIDAYSFMGEFMMEEGDYEAARIYLQQAVKFEPRRKPQAYMLADQGRQDEAKALIAKLADKSSSKKSSGGFNE